MEGIINLSTIKEASWWVWDNLWSIEQTHITFNILDTIRFSGSTITSWLFTMIDNKIKSKSKQRWILSSVINRCTDMNNQICGHALLSNDTWIYLSQDIATNGIDIDGKISTIISTAQVNTPYLFIEVSFEKQTGIIPPKVTCYQLCDSSVVGKTLRDEKNETKSFPNSRIQIQNKGIIEVMKDKISLLVSILEHRSKYNIQKITCIFLVEDYQNCATHPEYKIKLHHTKEIQFMKRKKKQSLVTSNSRSIISGLQSESGISDTTEITYNSRGYIHKKKCEGDFCTFNIDDESIQLQLSQELEFDINRERKRAIQRNRSNNYNENQDKNKDEDDYDYENDGNNYGTQTTIEGTEGINEKPLLNSTQSYKIPVKSILLARNEMKLLDANPQYYQKTSSKDMILELRHWSPMLLSWYSRIGQSIAQKYNQTVSIPQSSGHMIGKSIINPNSNTNSNTNFNDNETITSGNSTPTTKNQKKSLSLTSSSLKQVTKNNSTELLTSNDQNNEFLQNIPYDLNENPYDQSQIRSSKHIGRYYSSATVCERCYYVYKELDRLRKIQLKNAIKEKEEKEEELEESDYSQLMYKKIDQMNKFANQRITTYRLAKHKYLNQPNKLKDNNNINNHDHGDDYDYNESDYNDSNNNNKSTGPPKGILPPLPWQLKEQEKIQEYQQQGSSFMKNISSKAQKMREIANQKNEEYNSTNYQSNDSFEGLDSKYDWRKTVLSRYPNNEIDPRSGLVKSNSAGNNSKRKKVKKIPPKKFDHERLLHPYQRYFEQMKREHHNNNDNNNNNSHNSNGNSIQRDEFIENNYTSIINNNHKNNDNYNKIGKSLSTSHLSNFESNELSKNEIEKSKSVGLLPPLAPVISKQSSPSKQSQKHGIAIQHAIPSNSPNKSLKSTQISNNSNSSHNNNNKLKVSNKHQDDDEGDDDDDEDGIGWSPFLVSLN